MKEYVYIDQYVLVVLLLAMIHSIIVPDDCAMILMLYFDAREYEQ
jgi:hypothetical protein